jgi:hypothetical protein
MDTFVHDPLVDWARGGSSGGGRANDEGTDNPHAKDALATIEGGWMLQEWQRWWWERWQGGAGQGTGGGWSRVLGGCLLWRGSAMQLLESEPAQVSRSPAPH